MSRTPQHRNRRQPRLDALTLALLGSLLLAGTISANTDLLLARGDANDHPGEFRGVVSLVVEPPFENAKIAITVDGQQVATGLLPPYRVAVDFGQAALQHRIAITATGPKGKRVQWYETLNRGNLPLSLQVKAIDPSNGLFEAVTTATKEDPVTTVELWHDGRRILAVNEPPYRLTVPAEVLQSGFVQLTARTAAGEEVADFWSPGGGVLSQEISVRTVPIFVSVVDRHGNTRVDVDRTHFRILDNNAVGKIVEFGKAFDQPISIALLLDASRSMTYLMSHATTAASEFVERALKEGDRCSVIAIQDVPRRKQPLTGDRAQVAQALAGLQPTGSTALYDAIETALRELKDEKNRRAIVVLTDGADTGSLASFDEVHAKARQAGIPIYFIAYQGLDNAKELDRIKYLAAETGGFVATATQQDLAARYAAIEKDLRAQFAITYQVSDYAKANEYRRLRVTLDSPALSARTIKGYFAQ